MLVSQERTQIELGRTNSRMSNQASCFHCKLRAQEWCSLDKDLDLLDKAKTMRTYQPGQTIFYQGNPSMGIFCVKSGTIALRKLDAHGNETIVRLAHTGQTLGYQTYFSGEKYDTTAQTLTTAEVCFIDKDTLQILIERNPRLSIAFLKHIAKDLRQADDTKMNMATMSVRTRLAHLLLELKEHYGEMDLEGNLRIQLPISRQDMALMISTRPETLSRTIRAMEKDGVANFQKTWVKVPDLDVLFDEVEALKAA